MTHIMISNHDTVSCTLHQPLIFQKHARIDLIANVSSPSQLQTQRFDPLCYETKLYKLERNIYQFGFYITNVCKKK